MDEMIGKKFGRLTVLEYAYTDEHRYKFYKCICDCKTEKNIRKSSLKSGHTKSCGCLRRYNSFSIHDNVVSVSVLNNKEHILLDLEDWENLKEYTFHIGSNGYASCLYFGERKRMHQIIMKTPIGKVTDHINGNRLDNRKSNLRICSQLENAHNSKISSINTSGTKGVYWDKSRNKWAAQIKYDYKAYGLGRFNNIEDAIQAREEAEIKYFGEFRRKIS